MTSNELDDLILRYLQKEADEEQMHLLDERLQSDPVAAKRFAELSLQECLLLDIAQTESVSLQHDPAEGPVACNIDLANNLAVPQRRRRSPTTRARAARSGSDTPWAAIIGVCPAAAAAAAVLLFAFAFSSSAPIARDGTRGTVASSSDSDGFVDTHDRALANDSNDGEPARVDEARAKLTRIDGPDHVSEPTEARIDMRDVAVDVPEAPPDLARTDSVAAPAQHDTASSTAPGDEPVASAGDSIAFTVALEGNVEYSPAATVGTKQERWLLVRKGTSFMAGDRIRTKYARALLRLESGSRIYINHFTTLSFVAGHEAPFVSMIGGEVFVDTARIDHGFTVDTPHGTVVDLGTRFGVQTGKKGTDVGVVDGKVEASTDEGEVLVSEDHQVLLLRRTMPPGRVHKLSKATERYAWAMADLGTKPVAFYSFTEGEGEIVHDTSGSGKALDMKIMDTAAISWGKHSLTIKSPSILKSLQPAVKIYDACRTTNALTIEAWIKPAKTLGYGPERIVTCSGGHDAKNFTLGHGDNLGNPPVSRFLCRLHTTKDEGVSTLITPIGSVPTRVMHVVMTRAATGQMRFYVNGRIIAQRTVEGDFSVWDKDLHLAFGDEIRDGERAWLGTYYLVAIYSEALDVKEIQAKQRLGRERSMSKPGWLD